MYCGHRLRRRPGERNQKPFEGRTGSAGFEWPFHITCRLLAGDAPMNLIERDSLSLQLVHKGPVNPPPF